MAAQSITIRLALTDGGKVKAELADIGASGQKALERIRDASVPASRGLQLIDAAGSVLHGKFEELARDSGLLGEALQKIGPGGVAVASAIGAVVVALDQIASHTERAIDYLGKLAVESEQLGISAKAMQELTYTFRQAGVSAEDATGILVKFNTTLGQAMRDPASVSKQTAKSFSDLVISQQDVVEHGDDMNYMLRRLADGLAHSKSQAEATADAKELLGKRAAALLPILREGAEALDGGGKGEQGRRRRRRCSGEEGSRSPRGPRGAVASDGRAERQILRRIRRRPGADQAVHRRCLDPGEQSDRDPEDRPRQRHLSPAADPEHVDPRADVRGLEHGQGHLSLGHRHRRRSRRDRVMGRPGAAKAEGETACARSLGRARRKAQEDRRREGSRGGRKADRQGAPRG